MNARNEPLVDKFIDFVKGFQYHVGREEDLTGVVHDEDGVPLAALEQPLSFDRCIGDTGDVPVVVCTC